MVSTNASVLLRKSMENLTWPGITLRLLGRTCTMPTVPQPCGAWRSATATTSCISLAATCMASLRSAIGVGPACDSMQVTGLAGKCGQGQAADTAFWRGADFGQLHQRVPQARAVDTQAVDVKGSGH